MDVLEVPGQAGSQFEVKVPEGIAGQSYLLLSNCKERVTDDTIVAGPVIVEVSSYDMIIERERVGEARTQGLISLLIE